MNHYSQLELIDEAFWSGHPNSAVRGAGKALGVLGGVAAGVGKGLWRATDAIAPEITNPIKNISRDVKNVGQGAYEGATSKTMTGGKSVENILKDGGFIWDKRTPRVKTPDGYIYSAYKIKEYDRSGRAKTEDKPMEVKLSNSGQLTYRDNSYTPWKEVPKSKKKDKKNKPPKLTKDQKNQALMQQQLAQLRATSQAQGQQAAPTTPPTP